MTIVTETFLVCFLIYTRASSPYSKERYATGAIRISLPKNVAKKIIKGDIKNAPAKNEKTLSGSGVSDAINWAMKAFSSKSIFAFSTNSPPRKKVRRLAPYELYNFAPRTYIVRAPKEEPSADTNESNFQEISFRYARTTRRKASGRIGEKVASRKAMTKVKEKRCFVFESLSMSLSLCVKRLIDYRRRVPLTNCFVGLSSASPLSSLPAKIIPCDS